MNGKSLLMTATTFLVSGWMLCLGQGAILLNVTYKPEQTYRYTEVEERVDRSESKGEFFSLGDAPNLLIRKTKSTINKVFQTGSLRQDSAFTITVKRNRTREFEGTGIKEKTVFQDSVIVRGVQWKNSLKFDSVQLLPRNDWGDRDRGKSNITEIRNGHNYLANFFAIHNRKISPGEKFVNTVVGAEGKADSMTFTLTRIEGRIAILDFDQVVKYEYITDHIDRRSEVHVTGEIKIDLDKQLIILRKQSDQVVDLEKLLKSDSEIKSTVDRFVIETFVE